MASATFSHAGGTVTFTRTPSRPDQSLEIRQPSRRTVGGKRFGYSQIITRKTALIILSLTTTEKADLVNFFYNTVKGTSELFTYTDPAGTAYSVRFRSAKFDIVEKTLGSYSATVELVIF